jgi:predicted ArsR family transcriptional regulator
VGTLVSKEQKNLSTTSRDNLATERLSRHAPRSGEIALLNVFLHSKQPLSLYDLTKKHGISASTAIRWVGRLHESGMLNKEERGVGTRYSFAYKLNEAGKTYVQKRIDEFYLMQEESPKDNPKQTDSGILESVEKFLERNILRLAEFSNHEAIVANSVAEVMQIGNRETRVVELMSLFDLLMVEFNNPLSIDEIVFEDAELRKS